MTIPAGSTTASVTIDPTTDSVFENNETVIATITSASSNSVALTSTGGPATGTIVDNDQPTVSVAVAPASVAEDGTPNLVYTFTLSNPSAFATTVNYTPQRHGGQRHGLHRLCGHRHGDDPGGLDDGQRHHRPDHRQRRLKTTRR